MKPHVKALRKEFQSLVKNGYIKLDTNCAKCGVDATQCKQLELHHKFALKDVDPQSDYNPNVEENVITLCNKCHKGYHVSYEGMDMDQWLTDVPLVEVYEKLQAYRDERTSYRLEQIKKHRGKH